MAQKLIAPINRMRITAGYKNANYRKQFGYTHYGVERRDIKTQIIASNSDIRTTESTSPIRLAKIKSCGVQETVK